MVKFVKHLKISEDNRKFIAKHFPPRWDTEVREVNLEKDLEVLIRINAKTPVEIKNWIASFQRHTSTNYAIETTYKSSGSKVLFKQRLHCHRNTRHKDKTNSDNTKAKRNTGCPSIIIVSLRTIKKRYQGKDKKKKPDPNKPCEIKIKLNHNHSTTNEMALRFKKVLPEVKEELLKLYREGHKPATALATIKANIRLKNENYNEALADRSICPAYHYCHYLYQTFLKSEDTSQEDIEFLEQKLINYNNELNETCGKMVLGDVGYAVCFCPPLVKRVHQYHLAASNVVYLNSTPCNRENNRIFVLLADSECGGLPLGVIVASTDDIYLLSAAFTLLKDMLDNIAFGGNKDAPQVFITNEFIQQNNIISSVWPNSKYLLSINEVLQNIWKWLLSNKNIAANDRVRLFLDFHSMLHANTELELEQKLLIAKENGKQYANYLLLLDEYYKKKELWALCFRSNLFKTNDYSETAFRVMKDNIFHSLTGFNTIQIIDFIMNQYFLYFERKILDVATTGSTCNILTEKISMPSTEIVEMIQMVRKNIHLVPSEKVKDLFYMVNTDLLTCTCFNGNSGTICKHVHWICMLIHSELYTNITVDNSQIRKQFLTIATGTLPHENCKNENPKIDQKQIETPKKIIYIHTNTKFVPLKSSELKIKTENDACLAEGTKILEQLTQMCTNFLNQSPQKSLLALQNMSSKLQTIKDVKDFCSACNNFGPKNETQMKETQTDSIMILNTITHSTPSQLISNQQNNEKLFVTPNHQNKSDKKVHIQIHNQQILPKRTINLSGKIDTIPALNINHSPNNTVTQIPQIIQTTPKRILLLSGKINTVQLQQSTTTEAESTLTPPTAVPTNQIALIQPANQTTENKVILISSATKTVNNEDTVTENSSSKKIRPNILNRSRSRTKM